MWGIFQCWTGSSFTMWSLPTKGGAHNWVGVESAAPLHKHTRLQKRWRCHSWRWVVMFLLINIWVSSHTTYYLGISKMALKNYFYYFRIHIDRIVPFTTNREQDRHHKVQKRGSCRNDGLDNRQSKCWWECPAWYHSRWVKIIVIHIPYPIKLKLRNLCKHWFLKLDY